MKWKDDHEKGKQEKYILQETKTQEPEGKEINQGKKEDQMKVIKNMNYKGTEIGN